MTSIAQASPSLASRGDRLTLWSGSGPGTKAYPSRLPRAQTVRVPARRLRTRRRDEHVRPRQPSSAASRYGPCLRFIGQQISTGAGFGVLVDGHEKRHGHDSHAGLVAHVGDAAEMRPRRQAAAFRACPRPGDPLDGRPLPTRSPGSGRPSDDAQEPCPEATPGRRAAQTSLRPRTSALHYAP